MSVMIAPAYGMGGTGGGGGSSGGGLAVSATPAVAYGSRASASTVTVTSENVTLFITGGSGTYTVAWEVVSGATFTIISPAATTTKFSASVGSSAIKIGYFRALVSDGMTSIYSATVEVDLENVGTL